MWIECISNGRINVLAFLDLRFFCEGDVEQYGQQRRSDAHPWESLGLSLACDKRGTMRTAKGSDTRPGVPRFPPHLYGRRGLMCTAKGTDIRSGVPWSPPFLYHRVGQYTSPRGWMYALTSLDRLLVCVAGVEQCTSPRARMYALASLGLRLVCLVGMVQYTPPRGRIYALALLCPPRLRSFLHSLTHLFSHSLIHLLPWSPTYSLT